ncbi:MAG: hypothetical protein V3T17_00235, partial [Pseudomonadales bacterium]
AEMTKKDYKYRSLSNNQTRLHGLTSSSWIPACAGMTTVSEKRKALTTPAYAGMTAVYGWTLTRNNV